MICLSNNYTILVTRWVKEIAFEAGYDNEYYFYRQFKKYSGYSPGKLRKMRPF